MEPTKDNALATYEPPKGAGRGALALRELDFKQMMYVGELMFNANMFNDLKSMAQAQVKIIAGQELGLAPMQSMNAFHIIHGRATMAANTMAAKVMESGRYRYRVKEITDKICIIEFQALEGNKWVAIGTSSFSEEDGKRAGTQNRDKFPRNMWFARALSNGVKWFCPDVFGMPVYVEGEVIDEVPAEKTPEQEEQELREAEARLNRRKKASNAGQKGLKNTQTAPEPAEAPANPEPPKDAPKTAEPVASVSNGPEPDVETVTPDPETQVEGDPSTYMNPATGQEEPFAPMEPDPEGPHTDNQRKNIMAQLNALGFKADNEKRAVVAGILAKADIISFKTVTYAEAEKLKAALKEAGTDGTVLRGMFVQEAASA